VVKLLDEHERTMAFAEVALGQIKSKPPLSSLYDASLLPKIAAPATFPAAPAGSY